MEEGTTLPSVPGRSYRWWLGGACAVGLGLRLVYVFVVKAGAQLQGDAFYYHGQAALNLKGHWFVDPQVYLAKHPNPVLLASAQHPPVFTLLLTAGDLVGLRSVDAQLVLGCLIGTATIALTGVVTRDLVSPRAGAIAAVIAALYPGFWVFDGEVMSEPLVMLLAALVILAANRCFRDFTVRRCLVLAFLTGLCALTRAELVLLIPLVALPTIWWQRSLAWRRRMALCGLAVVVAVAPMVPWFARNFIVFHQPVFLSDQLPITLASANNQEAYYGPLTASWCYTCLLKAPPSRTLSEAGAGPYWDGARPSTTSRPMRLGRRWWPSNGWGSSGTSTLPCARPNRISSKDGPRRCPMPGWSGSIRWPPWRSAGLSSSAGVASPSIPLVAMFIVPTVAAVVTYGNYRFRSEAEVALVVLASVALDAVWGSMAGRPAVPERAPAPRSRSAGRLPARPVEEVVA